LSSDGVVAGSAQPRYDSFMALIAAIRVKVDAGEFEYSQHAVDQTTLRHIAVQEIREAIANGAVIEDYPNDKYGPSCLVLGFASTGRPIHVQCSYPSRPLIKIITAYEPTSDAWLDLKHRRR
jgi:hypothetical protein